MNCPRDDVNRQDLKTDENHVANSNGDALVNENISNDDDTKTDDKHIEKSSTDTLVLKTISLLDDYEITTKMENEICLNDKMVSETKNTSQELQQENNNLSMACDVPGNNRMEENLQQQQKTASNSTEKTNGMEEAENHSKVPQNTHDEKEIQNMKLQSDSAHIEKINKNSSDLPLGTDSTSPPTDDKVLEKIPQETIASEKATVNPCKSLEVNNKPQAKKHNDESILPDGVSNDAEMVNQDQSSERILPDEDPAKDHNESILSDVEHDNQAKAHNESITDVEFEDVEIPEEVDELIVPDADGALKNASDSENEKLNETADSEHLADEEDIPNDPPAESELVAIEEAAVKEMHSSEEEEQPVKDIDNADDPLNCIAPSKGNEGDANTISNSQLEQSTTIVTNNAEDDDDVQFIETDNSPICIESDEEDAKATNNSQQTINLPTSTVVVPKNLTVIRTCARKSTARPPQSPAPSQQETTPDAKQEKTRNMSYLANATVYRKSFPSSLTITPQRIVDTIVLDSSDEESSVATTPSTKRLPQKILTPPKRTLLSARVDHPKPGYKGSSSRKSLPANLAPQVRQQAKKPAPQPLPPATPQSHFLNNVQLQPASAGVNPPAFEALLSNRSVRIPNAFYGNPTMSRKSAADVELERRYIRWLEMFMTHFCNPQMVATHYCFVFLQRSLHSKDFLRLKVIRTNMNVRAPKSSEQFNQELMSDLKSIFLHTSKDITAHGKRFCEMVCTTPQNREVILLVNGRSGRVVMRSCNIEVLNTATSAANTSNGNSASASTSGRKRQSKKDEDEYVPVKNKLKTASSGDNGEAEGDGEDGPKRSLRSKRTKRQDNSFSYNEDDLAEYDIDDEEEAERASEAEIRRRVEQKRLEAQLQRQKLAKSFESSFIESFAKTIEAENTSVLSKGQLTPGHNRKGTPRTRIDNPLSSASVQQHLVHNDAEDLLQATWIENVETEDAQIISDEEEPIQHRIYKKQKQREPPSSLIPTAQNSPKENPRAVVSRKQNQSPQQPLAKSNSGQRQWPKNTNSSLHITSKQRDTCMICKLNVQRIVHHYVNEHRGCEVYTSRLSGLQLKHLRQGSGNILNVSFYKNGQPQYEASCVFCDKQSRFMLPYWVHHFTMHTGEYAYRCSGCGLRKPTRSLLTQHHAQGCTQNGSVIQDYSIDTKKVRVDARVCTLCNYVQLHRSNIVKHLHQQHGIQQILPKHIQTVVLLKLHEATQSTDTVPPGGISSPKLKDILEHKQPATVRTSAEENTFVIEDEDEDDNKLLFGDAIQSTLQRQRQPQIDTGSERYSYNYIPPYMLNASRNIAWNDNPAEDMSYMICGMLDVQMQNDQ